MLTLATDATFLSVGAHQFKSQIAAGNAEKQNAGGGG
jgi:hypothetical protein